MDRTTLTFDDLCVRTHDLWNNHWMLLTGGDFKQGRFNCMTVGWGSLGTMWSRPFAQVVVRPTRYTREFMDAYDTFTVCAFPEERRPALQILGTKSGRDGNKIVEAGLTPAASTTVAAPCFTEAELVIECRKIYWQDMDATHFLDATIEGQYPAKDYHRIYFGQILAISGTTDYRC